MIGIFQLVSLVAVLTSFVTPRVEQELLSVRPSESLPRTLQLRSPRIDTFMPYNKESANVLLRPPRKSIGAPGGL